MATQGQRKRGGGAKKPGGGSSTHLPVSLAAGLQDLSQLTGNRALLHMIARSKAQEDLEPGNQDAEGPSLEEKEELLADDRLKLEDAKALLDEATSSSKESRFEPVKEMLIELREALDASLRLADGYKGELEDLIKLLSEVEDTDEQAEPALLEALQSAVTQGEEIHAALVDRLQHDKGPLQIPSHLLKKLAEDVDELSQQAKGKSPPAGEAALGALGGGGLLAKKKKKRGGGP
jgi:hypothetical protein